MKVKYRQLFLKDLKKLKKQPIYQQIYNLVFDTLPQVDSTQEIANLKYLVGSKNRYRLRIGDYRIGLEINDEMIEVYRVLHRKEFYRYFP